MDMAPSPQVHTRAPVAHAEAPPGEALGEPQVAQVLLDALEDKVAGERVLVLVPDRTRNVPMAALFPLVARALHRAASVEVMVSLGTHPPLAQGDIADMLGIAGTPAQGSLGSGSLGSGSLGSGSFGSGSAPITGVSNHAWSDPGALTALGTVSAERIRDIAGPTWHHSLGGDLVVRANARCVEVDRVVVVGPTLPHEVAGFSGGAKYLFPGISGPEMIDVMHWLGALSGVLATIGVKDTPVRALIDEAVALLPTPVSMVAVVTDGSGAGDRIAAIYAGPLAATWSASVPRSAALHTTWLDHAYRRIISCPMPIYNELWTAGKAMYKLEPVVADGGELVIYAPELSEVSVTHGKEIFKVGYHPLGYFLGQWERFRAEPLAVLAHSSHVKGAGTFDRASGTEHARIQVKLASRLSPDDCARLNLGYVDPASLDLGAGATCGAGGAGGSHDEHDDDTLVVPRSGEMLFRVRQRQGAGT